MSKKISGKGLVIQLTSSQMRIIKTTLGSDEPVIQARFIADLPEGAVEDGVIRDLDAVREILQDALAAPEFHRVKKVVFSLCTTQVIAEDTSFPPVPLNKVDKMLQANMDMYFPVDTQNYHLTWQVVDKQTKKGDMLVQMWAVSTAIVRPYYTLANSCGLSVVAIDYCGHALASAVYASYAVPTKSNSGSVLNKPLFGKKKDRESSAEEELASVAVAGTEDVSGTELYLMAEPDQLQMLFVQDGQVKLQRISLCRAGAESELSEVLMALDYYDSMNIGRYGKVTCTLCGSLALNEEFVELTRDMLSIPVQVIPGMYTPEWTLCLGAARTDLDFGVPSLNRPGGISEINNAWQYGLILVGGIALALALVTTFGSKSVWTTTLSGLESTKQTLQIQAAQNANYAQNYYDYQDTYRKYSNDWNSVFNSLHTYNDNLVLMMDELEDTLPEETSVVGIQIADVGMALELAAPTKEQAAYTIIALRQLQYADLLDISDLAKPVYEEAPLVGSFAEDFLENALANGIITEDQLFQLIDSGLISEEALDDLLTNGTVSDQLINDILASGLVNKETMKELIESGVVTEDTIKDLIESGVITEDMIEDLMDSGAITDEMIQDLVESGAISDEMIQDFVDSGIISPETLQELVDNGAISLDLLNKMVSNGILTQAQLDKLLGKTPDSNDGPSKPSDKPSDKPSNPSNKPSNKPSTKPSGDSFPGGIGSIGNIGSLVGGLSEEKIISAMFTLTPAQMDILEDAYAPLPADPGALSNLLASASLSQRQTAFQTMLTKDPIGLYRFTNLFKIDSERPSDKATLHPNVYIGYWANVDDIRPLINGDTSAAVREKAASAMSSIVIRDNDCLTSAEKLMHEDQRLEKRYAYYLAVSMGKLKAPEKPMIDPNEMIMDIVTGKYPEGSDKKALDEIFKILFPSLDDFIGSENPLIGNLDIPSIPGIDTDKLLDEITGNSTKPGKDNPTGTDVPSAPGMSIEDILQQLMGGQNPQYPTQPIDDRYHFTVILGYKDALIAAERERKGLDSSAMIPELPVLEVAK